MYKIISVIIIFHFSLFTFHSQAQTLSECISYAKQHSLRIKTSDLQVQRAKRNEGTYFEIDKIELSLGQDPTSGGSPDNALTLSQSIDFPTVYTTRKKLLKAETEVEKARTKLTANELTREVSELYTDLLLYHHEAELLKQNDSILSEFVHIANIRFKNGETNRLEVMNAEQLKTQNNLKLQTALTNEKSTADMLQTLMNAEFVINPTDDYLPSIFASNNSFADGFSYTSSPQGELLNTERIRAEKELKYIRQGYMPSFSLGVRHQMVISGINPYNIDRSKFEKGNWMGFEFGVSFPLFFGSQKAKTAVAKYDVDIANAKIEEETQKANAEYKVAHNNLLTAYSNYQQQTTTSVKNAQEIRRLSLVEYQTGEITYVEHIQNLTSALETELSAAQATDDLNKAIINLNYIIGK